jgi:hypothetical protein
MVRLQQLLLHWREVPAALQTRTNAAQHQLLQMHDIHYMLFVWHMARQQTYAAQARKRSIMPAGCSLVWLTEPNTNSSPHLQP